MNSDPSQIRCRYRRSASERGGTELCRQCRCSFPASQNPQKKKDDGQADQKKYDAALAVKMPGQEAAIHTGTEHSDREDAQAILGYGERHGDRDNQSFSPRAYQKQMDEQHGRHE